MQTPSQPQPVPMPVFAMIQQPAVPPFQPWQLYQLLQIVDMDEADIQALSDGGSGIPARCRDRASQVASTPQFRNWVTAPASRELLVCGEHRLDGGQAAEALSLLCATLARALRRRERHVSLVFFCGLHADEDDALAGPGALMRSFIAQALRYHAFDTAQLPWEVDLNRVAAGNLRELCRLFSWLVWRLPREVTLVCLIDGIARYDCDEREPDMLVVLACLLGLVREPGLPVMFKLMATSEEATDRMHSLFKDQDECVLEMEGLPWVNQDACWMEDLEEEEEEEADEEEVDED